MAPWTIGPWLQTSGLQTVLSVGTLKLLNKIHGTPIIIIILFFVPFSAVSIVSILKQ